MLVLWEYILNPPSLGYGLKQRDSFNTLNPKPKSGRMGHLHPLPVLLHGALGPRSQTAAAAAAAVTVI